MAQYNDLPAGAVPYSDLPPGSKPLPGQEAPVAGAGPGGPPQLAAHPPTDMQPSSSLVPAALTAGDVGKGLLKGALNTVSSGDEFARKHLPAFMTNSDLGFGAPANLEHVHAMTAPHNTAQSVGKGIEQAGEFLIPGGAEEAVAEHAAPLLAKIPKLAETAPTLAKAATAAVGSGVVNKTQGGGFGTGAAAGAAGSLVGAGVKKVAPILAETAMKVRGADRAYGATPGRAILDETQGFSPRRVVDTARDSLKDIQAEQGNVLSNAPRLIALTPARGVLQDSFDRAIEENHPGTIKDVDKLRDQLLTQHVPNMPTLQDLMDEARENNPKATAAEVRKIATARKAENTADLALPSSVPAPKAAALNRGLSNAITSWNPATATDTMNAAGKMAHHQLGESIADVVPEVKPLNQRVQSLHPVIQRGNAADLNAGFVQRSIGRFGAHTGALTGAGIGGAAGYKEGGLPGAAMGASLGVLVPEMMASPEIQMMGARAANSSLLPKAAIPAARGTLLQFDRKKSD